MFKKNNPENYNFSGLFYYSLIKSVTNPKLFQLISLKLPISQSYNKLLMSP